MRRSVRAVIVVSFSTAIGCQIDEPDPEARGPDLPDELFVALERDLGQSRPALERRLAAEAIAAQLTPALRDQLGASFGGAWMNDDGSALVVGITDLARADEVRRAGAEPRPRPLEPRSARSRDRSRARERRRNDPRLARRRRRQPHRHHHRRSALSSARRVHHRARLRSRRDHASSTPPSARARSTTCAAATSTSSTATRCARSASPSRRLRHRRPLRRRRHRRPPA